MIRHDPAFIQNRIEWRAKQHGLPYASTAYWRDVTEPTRSRLPPAFQRPVVYSIAESDDVTIIGTEEVAVLRDSSVFRFLLDDIIGLNPATLEGKSKTEIAVVSIKTADASYKLPTEKGAACLAMMSIILMLSRLR